MFCPNCGKDCGEFKFCPDCGTQVRLLALNTTEQKKELVFPEPPLGVYRTASGEYMEITPEAVVFRTHIPKRRSVQWLLGVVRYEELARVTIVPGDFLFAGYLSVRRIQDKHNPLPKTIKETIGDETSIRFRMSHYKEFYCAYEFLKKCASIVNGQNCFK